MHKKKVLGYAARYAGRPPLAQSRLLRFDATSVEILTKDRKTKLVFPTSVFVRNLAEHVPDHYRHGVRCFGLWSPRGKNQTFSSLFLSLGKRKPSHAKLPNWRESIRQEFGRDPLITENGEELIWARRIPPNLHG